MQRMDKINRDNNRYLNTALFWLIQLVAKLESHFNNAHCCC